MSGNIPVMGPETPGGPSPKLGARFTDVDGKDYMWVTMPASIEAGDVLRLATGGESTFLVEDCVVDHPADCVAVSGHTAAGIQKALVRGLGTVTFDTSLSLGAGDPVYPAAGGTCDETVPLIAAKAVGHAVTAITSAASGQIYVDM